MPQKQKHDWATGTGHKESGLLRRPRIEPTPHCPASAEGISSANQIFVLGNNWEIKNQVAARANIEMSWPSQSK